MLCLAIHPHLLQQVPSSSTAETTGAFVRESDIECLVGKNWVGSLEYLDYQSAKPVTLKCNLKVTRDKASPRTWKFALGYGDEPKANRENLVVLSQDGKSFYGDTVSSRSYKAGQHNKFTIRITTESQGTDNNKKATLRHLYTITPTSFTDQKLVEFAGESHFFQRNIYRWQARSIQTVTLKVGK